MTPKLPTRFALLVLATALAAFANKPDFKRVPKVGQPAPDFALPDTAGKPVRLSELLVAPLDGQPGAEKPRWVLLIFYRGYW